MAIQISLIHGNGSGKIRNDEKDTDIIFSDMQPDGGGR